MIETISRFYKGYQYNFNVDPKQLELQQFKIKNLKNIEKIIQQSEKIEPLDVADDDTIEVRHVNNYLFNLNLSSIEFTQTAWTIVVDEIIEQYSANPNGVLLKGLTIYDDSLGTLSEGFICGVEKIKHYEEDDTDLIQPPQFLIATSIVWEIAFIDGTDIGNGVVKTEKYIIKVENGMNEFIEFKYINIFLFLFLFFNNFFG